VGLELAHLDLKDPKGQGSMRRDDRREIGVAVIGAGLRGVWNLAGLLAQNFEELRLEVVALCEVFAPRAAEASSFLEEQYRRAGHPIEIGIYQDLDACLADPRVELVMVTTHSDQHREPAQSALAAGKRVYLDKPLAQNLEDCNAILAAEREHGSPILLGFTRRYEAAWRRARELIDEGVIGNVQMVLLRAVIPYHVYFHGWHRERRFSGDALNDKSSHHVDAMTWFVAADPVCVTGFGGRRVYLPDPDAPESCRECDRICPYRTGPQQKGRRAQDRLPPDKELSWLGGRDIRTGRDVCVFRPGADILDHAVVNLKFENGVVGQLFYSIFGFDSEDQETFEIVGEKGRIRLIRHSGALDVVSEYGEESELIDARDANHESTHFGADQRLVEELRRFADGAPPVVGCRAGHIASATVFAALESIEAGGAPVEVARPQP
jgi:predicted dehydrogenase